MNLSGFRIIVLGLFLSFAGSLCVGHHLPGACGCRVSWVMMAEVARWETPDFRITWVGVSCLMSAVAQSC